MLSRGTGRRGGTRCFARRSGILQPSTEKRGGIGQPPGNKMRKYFSIAALLILFMAGGVSPPAWAKTVRVGVYDNAPLVFTDEQGREKGLFIDVLEHIAGKENWQLSYVPGSFFECLQRLESGKIDLVTTVAYSEERERRFDFTYRTMITNWGQVYTRKDLTLTSVLDLAGKKIAVMKGDIHNRVLQGLTEAFGIECRFIEADEKELIFELIENGIVHAGAMNRLYGQRNEKRYNVRRSSLVFNPIEIRYAVAEGRNGDIISAIDRHLLKLKGDSGSVYHRSMSRWLVTGHEGGIPRWILWTAAAGGALLLFFLAVGFVLRTQVKARTAELAEGNRQLQGEIAERRRAVAALKESEERFRQYFEEDLAGAYISRPDGTLIACNPAFAAIFGFDSPADAMAMDLDSIFPEEAPRKAFLSRLAVEKKIEFCESTLIGRKGKILHVVENAVGGFDGAGNLMEIKGSLIDVTEKKMLENQLFQASKMEAIGTLAGGIAHDFNNILAAIMGYAEMARLDLEVDSPVRDRMDKILAASHRAKEIVMQILAFSRQGESEREPLNLRSVVRETLTFLRASLPSTVRIEEEIEKAPMTVLANGTQMHQVLMNLCTNAFHAMEKTGGALCLNLRKNPKGDGAPHPDLAPGDYIELSVSDTGEGIDGNIRERIFDPYFTTKALGKGTGMGLAVVHGIVTSHGGAVTVCSAPGEGTTFHIFLPLVEDPARKLSASPGAAEMPKGRERVLLVDDEAYLVEIGKQMLDRLGYGVTAETVPFKALSRFREDPSAFDLVITDLTMPGMTGEGLVAELRKIRPDIPVIICSGVMEGTLLAEKEGSDFIAKPFKLGLLAAKVRKALDSRTPR